MPLIAVKQLILRTPSGREIYVSMNDNNYSQDVKKISEEEYDAVMGIRRGPEFSGYPELPRSIEIIKRYDSSQN
jgi:hypothetical protein